MRPFQTLFLLLLCGFLFAQKTYTGCITDEDNAPLVGVSVMYGSTGTITDINGCFSLTTAGDSIVLTLTYTGYETRKVTAYPGKPLTVKLTFAEEILDEVVVVGYGSVAKRDVSARMEDRVSGMVASPSSSAMLKEMLVRSESVAHAADMWQDVASGQLTAGEINDFGKWELWEDISQEDLAEFRDIWQLYPDHRYAVQLTYEGGRPAVDAEVHLKNNQGAVIWSARTDNRGRAELWRGMTGPETSTEQLMLVATEAGKQYDFPAAKAFKNGLNWLEIPLGCDRRTEVDIAFVVDATGSMGDEINYLASELTDVLKRAQGRLADADLRTAAVFYRDSSDEYVTRYQPFTAKPEATVTYVNEQSAGGGGDHPEAVDAALETAVTGLGWRSTAAARLLFLVLDAPPHQDPDNIARLQAMTTLAAKRGIRIIPVVCSGMTKDGEYLLRSMALATNGTYVFLTDDSGIGGTHLKPTTDNYEVEKLNDLLVRVIGQFSETMPCDLAIEKNAEEVALEKEALKFRVYPNPTTGPLTLRLPKDSGEVFVFDVQGKLLLHQDITSRKQSLELGGLASGTYLLRYQDGSKQGTERVVVTR